MKSHLPATRRQFLKSTLAGAAGALAFPTIVPSSVFGADAPSNKIHVAHIGCGRICNSMDLPGVLRQDIARVVAVSDLDSRRLGLAKDRVEKFYAKKQGSDKAMAVKTYADYRELLRDSGIDAVAISTPDHWHSEPVVAAALAGKDVYVQKPLSMAIHEGRQVSDVVTAKKRAFQIGSQQRSDSPWPQFRRACELVRNGRIGQLHTVRIGLPIDPAGGNPKEMPVPANLNYEMWQGWTPLAPYTEERVHPQDSITGRPGWLRIEPYCLGMITAWGSHHVDTAHWGMNTETTGPIEVEGTAVFPTSGLWNVHGAYHVEMKYANGVTMIIDDKLPNGVRFEGDEGWIFVTRGPEKITESDPDGGNSKALSASKPSILKSVIGPSEIHLYKSSDQHLNWLESIRSRARAATTPEIAHRSTSACQVAWISMKLKRKLRWDPVKEEFPGDPEANALRARPQRAPYGTDNVLKKA